MIDEQKAKILKEADNYIYRQHSVNVEDWADAFRVWDLIEGLEKIATANYVKQHNVDSYYLEGNEEAKPEICWVPPDWRKLREIARETLSKMRGNQTIAWFNEDWDVIGPRVLADMHKAGLIQIRDDKITLTAKGVAMLNDE